MTQATDVLAVGGDHAARADDADLAVAVEQLQRTGLTVLLQRGEVDVEADDGDDVAVFQQREGDAGHQFAAAGGFVEVGLQNARLTGVAGTGVEGVVRCAAGAWLGVGEQALVADHRLQFAGFALHPVEREASGFVAAQLCLIGETGVGTVQGVRLENDVKPEQVGLVDQGLVKLGVQRLAKLWAGEGPLTLELPQIQQIPRQPLAKFVGLHEGALHLHGLHFAQGLHVFPGRVGEHFAAGLGHLLAALVSLVQRQPHQQTHHQQQAEAGEQGDFALDREEYFLHGKCLFPGGETDPL